MEADPRYRMHSNRGPPIHRQHPCRRISPLSRDALAPSPTHRTDSRTELLLAYARCYQLETWFRELVYVELKTHFGCEWWPQADDALKRSGGGGIPPETSRDRDKLHPHMATPETDPLWFISFDALLKIVFDDQLWPLFECYLTTKELLQAKFMEIAPVRNRVAHCRSLHDDDHDRLRRILRDLDHGF